MFVSQDLERTAVLLINKPSGALELCDFGTQAADQAKVSGLELNELAQFDQS